MVQRTSFYQRPIERRPHQRHLDEVIEVPRLQRSVLTIVREAQQLPRFLRHGSIISELHDGRTTDESGRRTSPGVAESCQFSKIILLSALIGHSTTKAEKKGTWLEPDRGATCAVFMSWPSPQAQRITSGGHALCNLV